MVAGVNTVQAVVLLGWLSRDEAVKLLTEEAVPPYSETEAHALWEQYRSIVDAVPERSATAPDRLKLTTVEQRIADEFMAAHKRSPNIKDVVKVDPMGLTVQQRLVVVDQAESYASVTTSRAAWVRRWLSTKPTDVAGMQVRYGRNIVEYDVPHGEFGIHYVADKNVMVMLEDARHVSLTAYGARLMLWAGYHRSYAMASTAPEGTDRSLVAALTEDGTFAVSNGSPNPGLRAMLCGLRPPLFSDFFDNRFFIKLPIRKRRYVLQIRAQAIALDA